MNPQYRIFCAKFNWEPSEVHCGLTCQQAFDAGYDAPIDAENPFANDQLFICWRDGQRQRGND